MNKDTKKPHENDPLGKESTTGNKGENNNENSSGTLPATLLTKKKKLINLIIKLNKTWDVN